MDDAIDIVGNSGRYYRFQKVDSTSIINESGNFVFLSKKDGRTIICSGTAIDLSEAVKFWKETPAYESEAGFYARRNVTKAMRQVEHDDICLKHSPKMVIFELDGSRGSQGPS